MVLKMSWSDADVGNRDEAVVDFVSIFVDDNGVVRLRSEDNFGLPGDTGYLVTTLDELRKLVSKRLVAAEQQVGDLKKLMDALKTATAFHNDSPNDDNDEN